MQPSPLPPPSWFVGAAVIAAVSVLITVMFAIRAQAQPKPQPLRFGEVNMLQAYGFGSAHLYRHATITVLKAGTNELADIHIDVLGTPKANPFLTNSHGWWSFYTEHPVDVRITGLALVGGPEEFRGMYPLLGGMTLPEFRKRFGLRE